MRGSPSLIVCFACVCGQVNLFYWHGLIPYSAYTEWMSSDCAKPNPQPSKECVALLNTITDMIGPFDSDNLYTDLISGNATLGVGPTPPHSVQDLMNTYLNRTDVQQAIHARPTSWVACCAERGQSGTQCALNYTTSFPDMMPFYEQFFKDSPNLRILIYSGDTDIATCPHPCMCCTRRRTQPCDLISNLPSRCPAVSVLVEPPSAAAVDSLGDGRANCRFVHDRGAGCTASGV